MTTSEIDSLLYALRLALDSPDAELSRLLPIVTALYVGHPEQKRTRTLYRKLTKRIDDETKSRA